MITVTPNRFSASAGRLGDVFCFFPLGMITVTPNRVSASAERLGDFLFFPLPGGFYRSPEPDFRIGGAVGGCLLFFPLPGELLP